MKPTVLYLPVNAHDPSQVGKLAGIRRYCASRGWDVVPVSGRDFSADGLPDVLRRHAPVLGCIVEGTGNNVGLPPRLFQGVPVVFIGYMRGRTGTRLNFHFDTASIAEAAFRELSANRPPCYAAVRTPVRFRWASQRVAAFCECARANGARCFVFPAGRQTVSSDAFDDRLASWLAGLPAHCALFAVSDGVAVRVTRAAHVARRHIPSSLTLLSVDNFAALCESADPPISSIQLDFERMGFIAARALAGEAAGRGATAFVGANPPAPIPSQPFPRHTPPILVGPLLPVRRKSTSGRGRHEPWILKAVEIIRREACGGLTVKALVDRLPQSRRNFERRFREAMGCGAIDEILRVRLEMATTLLAQTDTAIGVIPDMCGFRSYRALDFHFRSRFKMGMGEWRRKHAR